RGGIAASGFDRRGARGSRRFGAEVSPPPGRLDPPPGSAAARLASRRGPPPLTGGMPGMLLVLDNYDSFTYNLVQYAGELGAEPLVYRNDALTPAEALALEPAAIIVSPGPCTPREAGISVALIRAAAGQVPVLGVCLGHQAIGEAFGGA